MRERDERPFAADLGEAAEQEAADAAARQSGPAAILVQLAPRLVVNQLDPRTVIVQGGAYGEHLVAPVDPTGATAMVGVSHFQVRLAPGAGGKLTLRFKRHVNQPTLALPWN